MIIKMRVKDIMKLGLWDEYCHQSGMSVWAVNEGYDSDNWVSVKISKESDIILED